MPRVRPEALAHHTDGRRANLADEVLAEVAEQHGLVAGGDVRHGLVDAVTIAQDVSRNAVLHVAHGPDVPAVAVLQLAEGGKRQVVEHEPDLRRRAVSRVDRMHQIDDLVIGDGAGDGGGLTEARGSHNAVRVARAIGRGELAIGNAAKALAEEFAEKLLDVEDRVAREFQREADELGVVAVGIERLLAEGNVLATIVGQGNAFTRLLLRGDGSVVNGRNRDRVAARGVDDGADVLVIHRTPSLHRLDDEVGELGRDSVAAGGRRSGLRTELAVLQLHRAVAQRPCAPHQTVRRGRRRGAR